MMTNLFTHDLNASRNLFEKLLNFEVEFESDWFISLNAPADSGKLGLMQRKSEFIPDADQRSPQGVMITVVVDDVEATHAQAQAMKLDIVETPRDLPYGQRRMLLRDPSGALVDISSPTAQVDERYV
jgi:predicted enzyme related to lactoylglutathione lyase